jgi:hypothetical protein
MVQINLPNFITTFVLVFVALIALHFVKSMTKVNIPGV